MTKTKESGRNTPGKNKGTKEEKEQVVCVLEAAERLLKAQASTREGCTSTGEECKLLGSSST